MDRFVGIEIERDREMRTLKITQTKYIEKIFAKYLSGPSTKEWKTPHATSREEASKFMSIDVADTQARLQAGFTTPLRDTVTARLIAAGWTGDAARDASDAIVGGVVYAILSEGRSFQTGRAESIARTVLSGVSAR